MNFALRLQSLRWDVDHLVQVYDDSYWWLKPSYINGKRSGITECCEYNYECEHHIKIRENSEAQKPELN